MSRSRIVLLGPQRLGPTLAAEVQALGVRGTIALVTAGWQEREGEDDELRAHLGGAAVNLALHQRAEKVFAEDTAFAAGYRARQDELRALQALYRFRLDFVLEPARKLLARRRGPVRWLVAERRAALAALRALDRQHLRRVAAIHRRFEARWQPAQRAAVLHHRRELEIEIRSTAAVVIAGGHVAVLLNRLRLFGFPALLADQPVFAWSAGAMALCERVVLFHDTPPQGAGNAEVLENGLGLVPGVVVLPDAQHRLELGNALRVALFARRFLPAISVPLDPGTRLLSDGARLEPGPGTSLLRRDGALAPWIIEGAA